MLEVLDLQKQVWSVAHQAEEMYERLEEQREAGGEEASSELEALVDSAEARDDELGSLRWGIYGLASDFNRSGVTQATLHPPTDTHHDRLEAFKEELQNEIGVEERAQSYLND